MRNHFSRHRKKPNFKKKKSIFKKPNKKGNRKRRFFMEKRREKGKFLQKPKKIPFFVAQRVWHKETRR